MDQFASVQCHDRLDLPVICRDLVELYSQLKADLCVLEGTVCLYGDGIPILLNDCGWLGHASHLSGGKAHTSWMVVAGFQDMDPLNFSIGRWYLLLFIGEYRKLSGARSLVQQFLFNYYQVGISVCSRA